MLKFWGSVAAAAVLLLASSGAMQNGPNTSTRVPQFENEEVRVWKSIVLPNSPSTFHRHDHSRVIVALKGGDMKLLGRDGESETHHWESGKAYWFTPNKPGTMHQDVNVGREPIEVMVVELKNGQREQK